MPGVHDSMECAQCGNYYYSQAHTDACRRPDGYSYDLTKVDCCNYCGHPRTAHHQECPITVAALQAQLQSAQAALDAVTQELKTLKEDTAHYRYGMEAMRKNCDYYKLGDMNALYSLITVRYFEQLRAAEQERDALKEAQSRCSCKASLPYDGTIEAAQKDAIVELQGTIEYLRSKLDILTPALLAWFHALKEQPYWADRFNEEVPLYEAIEQSLASRQPCARCRSHE